MSAASYLGLRIGAAGYTLDTFTRAFAMVAGHGRPAPRVPLSVDESRAKHRRLRSELSLLTRPGVVVRDDTVGDATLRIIASLIPFDPAVYAQLAGEPADRHPAVCRGCGCSAHDACVTEHDGVEHVCRTVAPGLCSHCLQRSADRVRAAA